MIKPDAVAAGHADKIIEELEAAKFTIIAKQKDTLLKVKAEEFYEEHRGKPFFDGLIAFMTSGPIIAMVLAKENAIKDFRELIGPTNSIKARMEAPQSIRAKYGVDGQQNAVHGSDSGASAAREIKFHFPKLAPEPLPSGNTAREYLQSTVLPVLTAGLTELCKKKPAEPISWLAEWLLENNPNKPKVTEPIGTGASEVLPPSLKGKLDKQIVFVLGGPGSGKGTQCSRLVEAFSCAHVSAGDLLRAEVTSGSEQGKMVGDMIKNGLIVPGQITINLLRKFIEGCEKKVILIDGFPREMQQALDFESQIADCQFVLYFDCPEETMRQRLLKRGETSGRSDDNEEAIVKRFRTFVSTSMPVIEYYEKKGKVRRVSSIPTVEEVWGEVKLLFESSNLF